MLISTLIISSLNLTPEKWFQTIYKILFLFWKYYKKFKILEKWYNNKEWEKEWDYVLLLFFFLFSISHFSPNTLKNSEKHQAFSGDATFFFLI